jgi:hypothetical protein
LPFQRPQGSPSSTFTVPIGTPVAHFAFARTHPGAYVVDKSTARLLQEAEEARLEEALIEAAGKDILEKAQALSNAVRQWVRQQDSQDRRQRESA